jgi:hypothetical protein
VATMTGASDDIVELLEYAKLAVIDADSSTSRSARSNLRIALLDPRVRISETAIRFADAAFAASDFLRQLAWRDDAKGEPRFACDRDDFAEAMECLIFEVGVARLRALAMSASHPTFPQSATALIRRLTVARKRLATAVRGWASGRPRPPGAPSQSIQR